MNIPMNSTRLLVVIATFLALQACKEKTNPVPEPEAQYSLSTESDLLDTNYLADINAFYETADSGFFDGKAGIPIHYRVFLNDGSDKAIMISSGRTEAAVKYKELIFDLYNNGYSIYIHDHRGQGLSGRMTEDPDMGYIDDFQYYIDDMKYFYDNYAKPKSHKNIYLLAHSMGGAIGMTYLEQYPEDFTAAAFSSPMLGLNAPVCTVVKAIDDKAPKYALGESEYKDDKSNFADNVLTHSEVRYNLMVDAFAQTPKARLGGATYTWVKRSCEQFGPLLDNIEKLQTPFILFTADNEEIVSTKAHSKFVKEAKAQGKDSEIYNIAEAYHELFVEKDGPRSQTLNTTLDFFAEKK